MKRYALPLALAFISVAFAAFAAWPEAGKIRLTNGSMLGYDQASATWRPIAVGTNGAIPIEGTVTIGTATVNPDTPPTANSMTAVSVTASAANVASLVNRKSVSVFNTSTTDTCWVSLDATAASATVSTSIPIPPMGYLTTELASAKTVSLVASAALTAVVYQDGY
jgi:hypothetical protein